MRGRGGRGLRGGHVALQPRVSEPASKSLCVRAQCSFAFLLLLLSFSPLPLRLTPTQPSLNTRDALGAGPPAPVIVDNGCAANGWGAEPVCCGQACALPSCPNSLWMAGTMIHEDEGDGCGALGPGTVDGVLCCKVQ